MNCLMNDSVAVKTRMVSSFGSVVAENAGVKMTLDKTMSLEETRKRFLELTDLVCAAPSHEKAKALMPEWWAYNRRFKELIDVLYLPRWRRE